MTPEELRSKKIGVLMGGISAERKVSLKSGSSVLKALKDSGFNAVGIDTAENAAGKIMSEAIDIAFISLHGRFGEDGTVQGMLELMGIPYTGSGVLASSLAMDKLYSKIAFASAGLSLAPYKVLNRGDKSEIASSKVAFPLVVKPSREGSSVGVSIVHASDELSAAIENAFKYDDRILMEDYIKGREIQVAVLEDKGIGTIEIVTENEFYDFEAKYTDGKARHICPALLNVALEEKLLKSAETAHRCLDCSGYSRVDFLVTEQEECFILEVNTLPGMTSLSLFPEVALKSGINFTELVTRIACSASLKLKCS